MQPSSLTASTASKPTRALRGAYHKFQRPPDKMLKTTGSSRSKSNSVGATIQQFNRLDQEQLPVNPISRSQKRGDPVMNLADRYRQHLIKIIKTTVKSMRTIQQSNRQESTNKILFKKVTAADEILSSDLPPKYKKKLRLLIQQYENQRINLLRNRIAQQSVVNMKQQLQEKTNRIYQLESEYSQLKDIYQFAVDEYQLKEQQFLAKIRQLNQQYQQLLKNQSALQELNQRLHNKDQQISLLSLKNNELEKKYKELQLESRKLKSVEIINQLGVSRLEQPSDKLESSRRHPSPREPRIQTNSVFRKASQNMQNSPIAINITHTNLNASKSKSKSKMNINESLKKVKKIFTQHKPPQEEPSETESMEFGKEKVVEKKKIKKLLVELIKSQQNKRRSVVDKIGMQIGLRPKEIQQFYYLF